MTFCDRGRHAANAVVERVRGQMTKLTLLSQYFIYKNFIISYLHIYFFVIVIVNIYKYIVKLGV